jgi:hypothetical protein
VIVLEVGKLTVYDGDDHALPMWREMTGAARTFNNSLANAWWIGSASAKTVSALDGKLCAGQGASTNPLNGGGLFVFDLIGDFVSQRWRSYGGNTGFQTVSVADFTSGARNQHGLPAIISEAINDVAMTVLPDAPIDHATGLQVPTIAVATDGGVSVIKDDGAVVSATDISGFANHNTVKKCDVFGDRLYLTAWNGTQQNNSQVFGLETLNPRGRYTAFDALYTSPTPFSDPLGVTIGQVLKTPTYLALGSSENPSNIYSPIMGLGLIAENEQDTTRGLSALTTSSYATGWLPGDIRGAFLADTDPTDLVGGTDADRSVKNTPLTVTGTITRAPVASGAELVEYRCGASDWLSQDFAGEYNGQSTFALIFWAKGNPSSQGFRWFETAGGGTSTAYLNLYFDANTGQPRFVWQGRISLNTGGDCPPHNGQWAHHVTLFEGGSFKHYQNGVLQSSSVHGITAELHELRISPVTTAAMALFRISNTIPTADQIRRIYEDEKVLFQENAVCTLYGASDAVTALAHDPDTGLLHVGTSAGRSVFKGLRRVDHTTQPVTTAISAANGMVIEQ